MTKILLLCVLGCLVFQRISHAAVEDPDVRDYFWGEELQIPIQHHEKIFYPDDNRANFTFFDGVENLAVRNGRLHFSLSGCDSPRTRGSAKARKATLGWGNYQGKQDISEVVDMWEEMNNVFVKVKQSGTESKWTLSYWTDGEEMDIAATTATLAGNDWTELELETGRRQTPTPDGLEIEIEGEQGAQFEIDYIKLTQPFQQVHCRKEFTLPEGKVWRAIADVGPAPMISTLYINGREVRRRGPRRLNHPYSVDIAPYLRPGKNCVALLCNTVKTFDPNLFFQTKIILTSGQVITWQTDPSWKYSAKEEESWNMADFDDSSWDNAKTNEFPSSLIINRVHDGSFSIPVYNGLLVIKNPLKKDLFYIEGSDIPFDIHIPRGLKQQAPATEYVLAKADATGKSMPVREGSVQAFRKSLSKRKESSLVYRINVGKHPHGVYTIALTLKDKDGNVIEERPREPLMVLRKLALREIEGKDYMEGLDLELEDTIDFTDPNDPHPWIEAKPGGRGEPAIAITSPSIAKKNGLVYRETADVRGAYFSYRFQFQSPGSFYLLELEYPDDAEREIEVSITTKTEGIWSNSKSGVGAETGGKLYLTGQMQKLRWIHVADPGVHSVDVSNVWSGLKASAESLRIYRIKGDLPSVGSGTGRQFGIDTERCHFGSGIGRNFGTGQPQYEEEPELPLMQRVIKDLVWMQEAAEKYAQYLKFAGQNTFIMGCYQYAEYNTPFVRPYEVETSRMLQCLKSVLANVLDANDITFYAGVEWSQFRDLRTSANNAQVAKGADTIWMVDGNGQQLYDSNVTTVTNWLHPRNLQRLRTLMEDLVEKFDGLHHFKGIHLPVGHAQRTVYWPPAFAYASNYDDPSRYSYDDVTFSRFETDTGIKLPVNRHDPQRFQKRHELVQQTQFKQRFRQWRCEKLREFLENLSGMMAEASEREDMGKIPHTPGRLELMTPLWVEDSNFFRYWLTTGKPYKECLKDFALDIDLLKNTENFWLGRWTISWRQTSRVLASRDPYCWIPKVNTEVTSAYDRDTNRYVMVRTSWDENISLAGGYTYGRGTPVKLVESDWIMNYNRVRTLPQPSGYNAREAFIQALITSDPDALMFGFTDLNINVGHEQELREFAKVYTHLPRERFETVLETGLTTNLAIRKLTKDDHSYFYVANPGYWHINGSIVLDIDEADRMSALPEVYDLVTGEKVQIQKTGGNRKLVVSLAPYGIVAYRVPSQRFEIESYQTGEISAAELSHMRNILDRISELISAETAKSELSLADQRFLSDTLDKARQALEQHRYALAWSLMTNWRFWSLWKESLEPGS